MELLICFVCQRVLSSGFVFLLHSPSRLVVMVHLLFAMVHICFLVRQMCLIFMISVILVSLSVSFGASESCDFLLFKVLGLLETLVGVGTNASGSYGCCSCFSFHSYDDVFEDGDGSHVDV